MHEEKNKIDAKYRAWFIGWLHIVYCFKTGIFLYYWAIYCPLFVVIRATICVKKVKVNLGIGAQVLE